MPAPSARASELAAFAYCQRAWHYQRIGAPHQNMEALGRGTAWHEREQRRVRRSRLLTRTGALLLLTGIALAFVQLLL